MGEISLKKLLALFLLLFLAACGNEQVIHDDFKKDVEQILPVLEVAYEDRRTLNEEEASLYDQFHEKYGIGQFVDSNGETYEMNDLEKAITDEINHMRIFTDAEETLASEEDIYQQSKDKVDEYLEAKEIPEELKGIYPTYALYDGIHPEVRASAQEIINSLDDVVNGNNDDVFANQIEMLDNFITRFEGGSFEVAEEKFKLNDEGYEVLNMVKNLKSDFDSGQLMTTTVEEFNQIKELIEIK